jgi:preprotein translocase subunit SecE
MPCKRTCGGGWPASACAAVCLKSGGGRRICRLSQSEGTAAMATTNPFQFLQQVRAEVAKVVWPTRREVFITTVMVFILAALAATFFSLVDWIIRQGLTLALTAFS